MRSTRDGRTGDARGASVNEPPDCGRNDGFSFLDFVCLVLDVYEIQWIRLRFISVIWDFFFCFLCKPIEYMSLFQQKFSETTEKSRKSGKTQELLCICDIRIYMSRLVYVIG